jgi:hypothetical protein
MYSGSTVIKYQGSSIREFSGLYFLYKEETWKLAAPGKWRNNIPKQPTSTSDLNIRDEFPIGHFVAYRLESDTRFLIIKTCSLE